MANPRKPSSKKGAILVTTSYVFDWVVIIALGIAGYIMGDHTPNKRPFYLSDPNIS